MLELVEGSIIVLIDLDELLLESFQLIFILWVVLDTHVELRLQFVQVSASSFDVLQGFKKEDFLLLIVRFDLLC